MYFWVKALAEKACERKLAEETNSLRTWYVSSKLENGQFGVFWRWA